MTLRLSLSPSPKRRLRRELEPITCYRKTMFAVFFQVLRPRSDREETLVKNGRAPMVSVQTTDYFSNVFGQLKDTDNHGS